MSCFLQRSCSSEYIRGNCSAHSAQTTKQKSGSETSTLSLNGGTCFQAGNFYGKKKGGGGGLAAIGRMRHLGAQCPNTTNEITVKY